MALAVEVSLVTRELDLCPSATKLVNNDPQQQIWGHPLYIGLIALEKF